MMHCEVAVLYTDWMVTVAGNIPFAHLIEYIECDPNSPAYGIQISSGQPSDALGFTFDVHVSYNDPT